MTENSPFGGGLAVADPTTTSLPLDTDDAVETDNRRKLAVVGAIAAVLVLLVAAFFLMKGKGGTDAAAPIAPHVTPPTNAAPAAPAAHKPAKAVKLPKSYSDPVGRDPFKALYTPPAEGATGAAGATTGTGTGTTDGTGTSTGTDATVTSAGNATPVWVELVKVDANSATFVVAFNNGSDLSTTKYKNVPVPKGATGPTVFAGVFGLVSVGNGYAVVQYGDGTPIQIMPGADNRLVVN